MLQNASWGCLMPLPEVIEKIWMINIFHPCQEIDLWEVDTKDDYNAAIGQGYVPLEDLRAIVLGIDAANRVGRKLREIA